MIKMNKDEKNRILAQAFMKEECLVHVSKRNNKFLNGIIKRVFEEFFTIDDREYGPTNVFFWELNKPLEEYEEERE